MHELALSPQFSTTVRSFYGKLALRWLDRVLPGPTTHLLTERFLTPVTRLPPQPGPAGVRTLLLDLDGTAVEANVVGDGPLVLLIHGWASSSAQLTGLRDHLLGCGFALAWVDAPAHGDQPGRRTHIGQFVHLLLELQRTLGTPYAVIGHSLGGLAAALAQSRGLACTKLVLFAPLPSFDFALDHYQMTLGLPPRLRLAIAQRLEQLVGITRAEAELRTRLEHSSSDVIVIHDAKDRTIPARLSRAAADGLPHVEYIETNGLGHRRLLENAEVHSCVEEFLKRANDGDNSHPSRRALA